MPNRSLLPRGPRFLVHFVAVLCVASASMTSIAAAKDPLDAKPSPKRRGEKAVDENQGPKLTLSWEKNMLTVYGEHLPGGEVKTWYLEAYCRPGSTDRVWNETVIGHTTELVSINDAKTEIKLRCTLKDGVIVDHKITAGDDAVSFRVTAHNPTDKPSLAHWAQPCTRVGAWTGHNDPKKKYDYITKSFVFMDGKLAMMPTKPWATEARYIPGQVWRPKSVPRDDVNPRPLNPKRPSNGLIGCVSHDDKMILAMAWEPYQELFQGVIICLHSDFRIGGLKPGEKKSIRGKMYFVKNDVPALLKRYRKDFPEHVNEDKPVNGEPEVGKARKAED